MIAAETQIIQPGTPAPALQLFSSAGQPIDISSYWRAQPVLFFFLRHAGCALCRAHMHKLRDAYADFQRAGAGVLLITFADAAGAAQLQRGQNIPFPVLADPARRAYRAFGLVEGPLSAAIGPDVLLRQLGEALRGNIPYVNPANSHITQLGGSVIVDRAGVVRFAHLSNPIYHYPSIAEYLAVLADLAAGAPIAQS